MSSRNTPFCPYLSDGLLYLPDDAMTILARAGISAEVTNWVRRGMMLADVQRCDEIISTLTTVIETLNRKLTARASV